jgi:hypothetical protein
VAIVKFILVAHFSITDEGCTGFPIFVMAGGSAVNDCAREAPLQNVGTYDS